MVTGFKRGDFLWNEDHKCYVYQNKVFSEREFNAVAEKVFKLHYRLLPQVRVVKFSDDAEAPAIAPAPVPQPAPAAVEDFSPAAEVTADEAEKVLARERPWRLKRQVGRPANESKLMRAG
jgi:hypothetical protein